MYESAITHTREYSPPTNPNLEEKYRRVVKRRSRLELLVEIDAPGIIIRNEKRMLRAALDDFFGDTDAAEFVSPIGAGPLTHPESDMPGIDVQHRPEFAAGASLHA